MTQIPKVVLTGGPRAGKSSVIDYLKENLPGYGIQPYFVPETITHLFAAGFKYVDIRDNAELNFKFQHQVLCTQWSLEDSFSSFSKLFSQTTDKKIVLICDRGLMDNFAYLTDDDKDNMLGVFNSTKTSLISRYDLILHLQTSAVGEGYGFDNEARHESIDEAIDADARIWEAWTDDTANRKYIPYSGNFEDKNKKVLDYIVTYINKAI
ncbi:MAG: ATP-binding protein [Bacteroidetes bacterium]|nr:ATP-binding protein [Bacteroidota bacterium]